MCHDVTREQLNIRIIPEDSVQLWQQRSSCPEVQVDYVKALTMDHNQALILRKVKTALDGKIYAYM